MDWTKLVHNAEVEPSLYAADFSALGEQVKQLLGAGARVFHFDIGDGHFVDPITIGPIVLGSIAPMIHEVGGALDVHLMVDNPERHIEQVAVVGGDSVTFHFEATDDPAGLMAIARRHDLGVGLAFNPDTPVDEAAEASIGADLVLCMSIHPGYSGQEFMPEALDRICHLRDLLPEKMLQVDGGITAENIRAVHEAGAGLIVAGSAIFHGGDLPHPYYRLLRALE